jgi:predicted short-subunit dehydrogenase-like oxidoreductase (DUF2520 family)
MGTLTVGVIGAGRVGRTLAAALTAAGHRVTIDPRPPDADLVLLAVPDDALPEVVAGLGSLRPDQVVAHTSGAHGLAVLAPAGGRPLALHPAMTFTGDPAEVSRLPGISYGVTAPDDLRPFATRLVADLGGTVEWIAEPDRPLYHAALSHGANHLVTLVNEAAELLARAGVRQPPQLLAPLLRAALENTLRLGDAALTGPVARGDAGTIARHLRVLAESAPAAVPAYRALARRTADRALAAGTLTPAAAAHLRETEPA